MNKIINDLQYFSLFNIDAAFFGFTLVSILIFILNILLRMKNNHSPDRPPKSVYHFTMRSRMKSIIDQKCMRGGHHGTVFTTANRKYRNRGSTSGLSRRKDEATSKGVVIFKGKALSLFQCETSSRLSLLTGHKMFAEISDEFTSREKGSLELLKHREIGNILVVTDAKFVSPPALEKQYMRINGFLLSIQKTCFTFVHIATVLFWVNHLSHWNWFQLNWSLLVLIYFSIFFLSLLAAESLYAVFKHLINL